MAISILSSRNSDDLLHMALPGSIQLCLNCQKFRNDIWNPSFSIVYYSNLLRANSSDGCCDICSLLWKVSQKTGNKSSTINFSREGSAILLNGYTHVASLFRSPDLNTALNSQIQIGLPTMPLPGSPAYLDIIRKWLHACDSKHEICARDLNITNSSSSRGAKRLPTRVIAVGSEGDDKVRLIETNSTSKGAWVALSHQWGTGAQFCTRRTNLHDHVVGISMERLPATFRDSVIVTRALGCPFLWIDSLCIIQGPDGDFSEEAKRMERVYSGAYCVLAASRTPGHNAGFLGPRNEALGVTLRQEGQSAPFYLRENIDDFESHVLNGPLSQRGWVLQERALARRTVYFTDHQTYFECGDGVRCESMSKMTNQCAAFLGDPNFPRLMMKADKGAKILGYQDLYKLYSGLALSRVTDRPWAINGLQERIVTALNVQGQFGMFFEDQPGGRRRGLLRRSLLWRRAEDVESLSRISFSSSPGALIVPSWSWMAYEGRIDYIQADFGGTEWEALQSQWDAGPERADSGVLAATARDYSDRDPDSRLVFDSPPKSQTKGCKCVVLGKQKGDIPDSEKVHYVLLVQPKSLTGQTVNPLYERVGAGTVLGRCIEGNSMKVDIC
ncbi:het-domain protein [Fusarium beomiforme]|uniref:Het-domain protein n=1 Tax=Fusarium beomiforme TaxID=44412 RepID=A0A9P5DUM6_9HYPO|nr:het-domain protein [Fusarium beomiforme]